MYIHLEMECVMMKVTTKDVTLIKMTIVGQMYKQCITYLEYLCFDDLPLYKYDYLPKF